MEYLKICGFCKKKLSRHPILPKTKSDVDKGKKMRKFIQCLSYLVPSLWFMSVSGVVAASSQNLSPDNIKLENRVWNCQDHELEELEKLVTREIQMQPKSSFMHYLLSHITMRRVFTGAQNFILLHQAMEFASQSIALEPHAEYGYIAEGYIAGLTGKEGESISKMNRAIELGAQVSWRIPFMMLRLKIPENSIDQSLVSINIILDKYGESLEIIAPFVLAMLESSSVGDTFVLNKIQKLNQRFPHRLFDEYLARNYAENDKPQLAHQLYKKIYTKDPSNIQAKINDAIIMYRELGDHSKGMMIFDELLKNTATSAKLSTNDRSLLHAHLGLLYLRLKKIDLSTKHLIVAIKENNNQVELLRFIGQDFLSLGKEKQFTQFLESLSLEVPGQSEFYALLGDLYAEKIRNFEKALKYYDYAITLDATHSEYFNSKGLIFYEMKSYEEALFSFERAIAANSLDALAYYNKACILSLQSRLDESLNFLAKAIDLNPRFKITALDDDDFANVKHLPLFQDMVLSENIH